jgi:hypothetical protein
LFAQKIPFYMPLAVCDFAFAVLFRMAYRATARQEG